MEASGGRGALGSAGLGALTRQRCASERATAPSSCRSRKARKAAFMVCFNTEPPHPRPCSPQLVMVHLIRFL